MRRPRFPILELIGCLCAALSLLASPVIADDSATGGRAEELVDFVRDVRPLLEARCWDCHGPDTREAGLRLDRRRPALLGGDTGQVIKPHDAAGSPLVQRITSEDESLVMPPGDRLSADEVAILTKWVEAGAPWPEGIDGPAEPPSHWAYQSIARAAVPRGVTRVPGDVTTINPIDAFVLQRLEDEGIEPSPEADRYTLIKRLSYDLLGLPPEPAAVDAFVNDTSADAYERLVDELLSSPHFGERWGRHWLDLARYADSDGYEKDRPRYNAWKYRDWVIDAVNDDMPFDRFTIEQLAGDLLPEATDEQLLATAFNRQTLTNTEGGTDQEQWRVEAVFDRVETLGTAWLGLTVGCARCHSHKYDDISQREYYQLFAFFNNGDEVTEPMITSPEAWATYREQKQVHDAKLAALRRPLDEAREAIRPGFAAWQQAQRQTLAAATQNPATFRPLQIASVVSEAGATIEPQEDGSLLVNGQRPKQDVTVITVALDQPLSGLRLEVLADESLPANGPGRADNGNLVLSEITASLTSGARLGSSGARLTFAAAKADFSQGSYPVDNAIDGVEDSGGWALKGAIGKNHAAVFAFSKPLGVSEEPSPVLVIRLSQQYDKSPHTIGRFRLSGMTGTDPELIGLPESIRKRLAVDPAERNEKQGGELFDYYASLNPDVQKLQANLVRHRNSAPFKPEVKIRILRERTDDRRQTHVMKRGDFLQPLGDVEPATLETLHDLPVRSDNEQADRLDLARWLVSPDNPLTPRVTVNRIWSHLFGRGLVKTIGDFGARGEPPTHPLLLDWLASEFLHLDWSRKQLIRTIVMSQTYRQSSAHRPDLADVDPENRLLSRQNRFRVEAEIVRDLSLAASGQLDRRVGGPSVFPPLPSGIAELSYAGNFKWGNSDWNTRPDRPHATPPRDDVHRRGLYTFFKRTAAHPNLVAFDCPDANTTCVERRTSNTPLQALTTLNNEIYVQTARALARRIVAEVDTNAAERMIYAFRLCAVRPPANAELTSLLELLTDARQYYAAHPDQAETFGGVEGRGRFSAADAAAWASCARILMNLDEFVTRE